MDYLNEIDNYRKEANDKIDANNKSIAENKARVANEKNDVRAEYKLKIAELEKQVKSFLYETVILRLRGDYDQAR